MDPDPDAILRVTTVDVPGQARVVRLAGETGLAQRDRLGQALAAALREPPPLLVVDLSGLAFCDSTGLSALIRLRLATEDVGTTLVLAAPSRPVIRLIRSVCAEEMFVVHGSIAAALAGTGRA
ncbi:STAS domain-containing protein (plasmid) [Kitasatospora sp. NBC_00070]|uniref:STAS domain-containing protein n=1 Tax=Kitasatospora sp. NBC_00070 TaxID=2975962 RepID=UPI0032527F79